MGNILILVGSFAFPILIIITIVFKIKKNPKAKKTAILIPICFIMAIAGSVLESSGNTENYATSSNLEESNEIEDKFLTDLVSAVGEEDGNTVYDILKNQIGFKKLSYIQQLGNTLNYEIEFDDVQGVVTISDGYYRVFIPNTLYVFYEDGNVNMTAEEFENRKIDTNEASAYYVMAKEIIKNNLKSPKSAKFPMLGSSEIGMGKKDDIVLVHGYVDAKNSFNAEIRNNWTVEFKVTDLKTYSYQVLYIDIDGNTSGTYVDLK